MKLYPVTIDVMAYSEEEAKAKVDLFIALGAFLSDFDLSKLAAPFLKYQLLNYYGKIEARRKEERKRDRDKLFKSLIEGFKAYKAKQALEDAKNNSSMV